MTDREKIAHLLRRFGLGASEAELDYYGKGDLKQAIDLLMAYKDRDDVTDVDPMAYANKQGVVNIKVVQGLEMLRMICTHRPLEEKLTLFWHNHFAVARSKVELSWVMRTHVGILRRNALGSFKTMLKEVSEDPAMLYYLDNQLNVVGKPNENFAREVMELFTLGIGHYTEKDIQEAARAFTGWRYGFGPRLLNEGSPRRRDRFLFASAQHDTGDKTIFGKSGDLSGYDVLDMLCDNPQTARYLTEKAWKWFAYEDGEAAVIDRIAKKYHESGLDNSVLFRSIMEAPEFYSEKSVRRLVKNPIDFAMATVRQLGVGAFVLQAVKDGIANPNLDETTGLNRNLLRSLGPCMAVLQTTTSQGLEYMNPPDVSGWRTGNYWITSATMVERAKWADRLFGAPAAPGGAGPGAPNVGAGRGGGQVNYQAWLLLQRDPTPEGVVESLLSVFDAPLPASKKADLIQEASGMGAVTPRSANEIARKLSRLIFSSPEFQFA